MCQMIDEYYEVVKVNGIKIVYICGFDFILFDMGVFYMQWEVMVKMGKLVKWIKMCVCVFKGEMSGGIYVFFNDILEKVQVNKKLYGVLMNFYSFNLEGE